MTSTACDTANKIRILVNLITNTYRTVPDFQIEGIRDITPQDIQYAAELGYAIKLVGVIEQIGRYVCGGRPPGPIAGRIRYSVRFKALTTARNWRMNTA